MLFAEQKLIIEGIYLYFDRCWMDYELFLGVIFT